MNKIKLNLLLLVFTFWGIMYVDAQTFQWAKRMGGIAFEAGQSITVDVAGNVYSSGEFIGSVDFDPGAGVVSLNANAGKYYVSKLTTAGVHVWAKNFGAGATAIAVWTMATDPAGNLFLAGSFNGTADFDPGAGVCNFTSNSNLDGFLLKLSSAGIFMWAVHYHSTMWAEANAVATDAAGNAYVIGEFQNTIDLNPSATAYNLTSAGLKDIFITKLTSAGAFVWGKRIGSASGDDEPYGITSDAAGNTSITGYFDGSADFDPNAGAFVLTSVSTGLGDAFVTRLDAAGNFIWARRMGGVSAHTVGMRICADAAGNLYIGGSFTATADFDPGAGVTNLTSAGLYDVFICKLTSAGNFSWAKRIGGPNSEYSPRIDVDAAGNIYIGRAFEGTVDFNPGAATVNLTSAGSHDIYIMKLTTLGTYHWVWRIGSTGSDFIDDLVLDNSNNLYSTGGFENTVDFNGGSGTFNVSVAGSSDIFVHKVNISSPLPIELLTFEAIQNKTAVDITWQTATETNNDYFTIEKSKDGNEFEEIGKVNGAGNSTLAVSYSFTDEHPYNGISYYRLKQTDFNGQFSYSKIVAVRITDTENNVLVYPNPFHDKITININSENSLPRSLILTDLAGRIVISNMVEAIPGFNSYEIDARSLAKGVYLLQVKLPNESWITKVVLE